MSIIGGKIKEYARQIGFDVVGVTTAEEFAEARRAIEGRMEQGLLDCFPWFNRERLTKACSPSLLVPSATSVISLAASYAPIPNNTIKELGDVPRGRLSSYAVVNDYHAAMRARVELLRQFLQREADTLVEGKIYIDTGPVLEKAVAQRAGLGWYGKHTILLVPGIGSRVFLGELITNLEIEPDHPLRDSCGSCRACIEACPTGALLAPYTLDARRCISYLTVELKGWIPRELRSKVDQWVFGCDVCQEACPVNALSAPTPSSMFAQAPGVESDPSLIELLTLGEEDYRARFLNTSLRRTKRTGLRRNAAVALGNSGDRSAARYLVRVLEADGDELVRGHAAWALGRLGGREARATLERTLIVEASPDVATEIEFALQTV